MMIGGTCVIDHKVEHNFHALGVGRACEFPKKVVSVGIQLAVHSPVAKMLVDGKPVHGPITVIGNILIVPAIGCAKDGRQHHGGNTQ